MNCVGTYDRFTKLLMPFGILPFTLLLEKSRNLRLTSLRYTQCSQAQPIWLTALLYIRELRLLMLSDITPYRKLLDRSK
jgi:hypothetical protein